MFGKRKHADGAGTGGAGERPRRSAWRVWIRNLAIAALAALVVVAGLFFWVLESARKGDLSERLLHLANRLLTSSSNLRVYAEGIRVDGGNVELTSLQVDAREAGKWYRVLDAKRARFRSDLQALVLHRPQVFDVRLTSPVIHLVTADDGRAVIPQFQSTGKSSGGGGLQDGFVLTLDDATLRAHAHGDSTQWWEDGSLVARLHPQGGGYAIGLDHATGRFQPIGLVLRSASGSATAIADTIRLASLEAETDAGQARLSGSLEGHRLLGTFKADDWPWDFFGDLLEQPTLDVPGGVSVQGQVGGTVEKPEFRTGLDGHWRDEPFRGAIDGRVVSGGLAVSRAVLDWRRTHFDGTAQFAQAGRWQIAGRVSDIDLSQVERLFPGVKLPKSDLTGPARIAGSQGSLEIATQSVGGSLNGMPLSNITGSWTIRGRQHQVTASGTVAGGDLAFSGGWDAKTISLAGTASHEDLGGLRPWVPELDKASGTLEPTHWSITGDMNSPRIRLDGAVSHAEVAPASAGWIGFQYDGTWGKAPAGVGNVEARDLAIEGWHADTLWTEVRHVDRHMIFSPLEAERGDTTLVARVELQPKEDGWRILADTLRLDSERGWVAADGPLDIESDHGQWLIHHAALSGSAGHLELAGRFRNENDLDLQLTGRGLAAAELASVANLKGWGGDLTLDAHATSDATRRLIDVSLSAARLVSPVLQADSVSAALALEESGGILHIQKLHAVLGHSVLDASGQAELTHGQWPLDPAQWAAAARHSSGWRGDVKLVDFDLSRLSTIAPDLAGLEGRATGSLTLGGSADDPVGGSQGTIANIFYHGHPVEPIQWNLRYENRAVHVDDLRIGLGDSAAVMRGTIPLDLALSTPHGKRFGELPVDLSFEATKVSLGEIGTFLPFIAYSEGVLAAHLHLGGVSGHWRPSGTVDVSKGRLRFAAREEVYSDVQAHLVLDSTFVRVENLKASQGKDGLISGSGTIAIGKGGVQSYDLNLQATKALALASGEYEAHFDGAFHIGTGPRVEDSLFPLPSVTGKLTVRDGLVLYDFADPTNRVYFAGPKETPVFVYDIDVYGDRQIYWRTPSANIDMKVDLNVVQTLDDFQPLGSVEAQRGSYYFLGNKFQVDSGTLVFDSVDPMNPTVSASAHVDVTSQKPPVRVTITLSERIQTPEITMTSDNGMSQADIVTLLTLGYNPSARYDPTNPQSGNAGKDASMAATAMGSQYLLRQLSREFPEITPVLGDVTLSNQVVKGDQGQNEIVPTIELNRDVNSALSLKYSQIVGAPTSSVIDLQVRDFGAEYRINKIFYLTGEILERRPGSSSSTNYSQSTFEYNLDVRARHEY